MTSRLRYWHPVLAARGLPERGVVAVRVAGRDIALFRTAAGGLGVLEDRCAHRRLKLSVGRVVGDRLRCAYHGWSYTVDGRAESPGTPALSACATSYACREAYGAIWIREREADQPMPDLAAGYEGWGFVECVINQIPAPLALLLETSPRSSTR